MYEYKCKILRVVDGDTVDVDIDLGFGMWMHKERVRMMGIDTPESRTRDKVEKAFGLASKERLKELLKFGRVLGDFLTDDERRCTDILVEEGHAVAYFGGSKDDVDAQHMANRTRLLENGTMTQAVYDAAVEKMK